MRLKVAELSTHLVPAAALQSGVVHNKGPVSGAFLNSGGRIRTCDLRVMSSLALVDRAGFWLVQAVQVGPSWI